ncbi:serine/threonine protein kinase [Yoonia litorea]|uniref:Serine/threonine protein kinase n=1 Tax=Yoonia litorea TaxID=1123755 RepID=A0A1I6MGC9_9RHOB|nr:serine/threonine-protein kinase [Yoonia litorea]SFS14661.1 Serine/threonine protein kinase [Yoonia litorea]
MEKTRILDEEGVAAAPDQALAPDTLLQGGKFRIDQQIGAGGFGMTYLAKDAGLERTVVIKECFADGFCERHGTEISVADPEFNGTFKQIVAMFIREARSIAMLKHPNIVRVHQVFEENGTAYMVLDLIEGRDLADIIELGDEELSPDQIHGILIKLLDAVDLVHSNGLLHRDISPDNVLLDKWGGPILIDFGAVREGAEKQAGANILVVKDGYSPHEFYDVSAQQGASSDLYALGATIYHLISGEAPADAETRANALAAGTDDPCKPLLGRFPDFDDVLLETVDQAMQVDPDARIQSARHWLERIEAEQQKERVVKVPLAVPLKEISAIVEETNKHVLKTEEETTATDGTPEAPSLDALQQAYRPEWVAEFNLETARSARRRPGQSHIAQRAARMAKKAMREDEAREMLRQIEWERQQPPRRRAMFEGFFSDSYIVQWMSGGLRAS